jgi:hypothetical protein
MRTPEHPWYWSWRGWRASTWLFLYWSAVLWPAIVATAASDEVLAGIGAAFLIGLWAAGGGLLALGRFLAGRIRARIGAADGPRGGRPVAVARKALPFVAALFLLYLVAASLLAAENARPSEVESAVEREWKGRQLTVPIGFGIGGSEPETATAPVTAEDVSCDGTGAELHGAAVHACTIVHCDVDRASMFGCGDTTSPACAALVGDELMLVSGTWSAGPSRLREQILRVPECTF